MPEWINWLAAMGGVGSVIFAIYKYGKQQAEAYAAVDAKSAAASEQMASEVKQVAESACRAIDNNTLALEQMADVLREAQASDERKQAELLQHNAAQLEKLALPLIEAARKST